MNINKADDQIEPKFAVEDPATKVWARAKLSLLDAKKKDQRLPISERVKNLVKNQEQFLMKSKIRTAVHAKIQKGMVTEEYLRAEVYAGLEEGFRKNWQDLAPVSDLPNPNCAFTASSPKADAPELTTLLKDWNNEKIDCLVFAYLAFSPKDGGGRRLTPWTLLQAVQQADMKPENLQTLKISSVIQLLEGNQYAESLRILVDLQDSNPSYRVATDIVQRIFSLHQHGDGKVAIRGI
jgi:hypothetical protein